jgi:protein-disulfide isomerase
VFFLILTVGLVIQPNNSSGDENQNLPTYSNNPIVAIVDGEAIKVDDLKNAGLQEMMVGLHQRQEAILKQQIIDRVLKNHPELASIPVRELDEQSVRTFYDSTPGVKKMGPYEKVAPEIRQFLGATLRKSYVERVYQEAVKNGWVKNYLTPPNDFNVVASVGTAALKFETGKTKRAVFFLEYSDFQCPFCKRVQGAIDNLRAKYFKTVQFGYRHFPLPFHTQAGKMAEAAECARDQGRFWEMQSLLYQKELSSINNSVATKLAKEVGVKDISSFNSCWENRKYQKRVENDIQEGGSIGIQGTPTFIIGVYDPETGAVSGEMMSGALEEAKFTKSIEKFLTLANNNQK